MASPNTKKTSAASVVILIVIALLKYCTGANEKPAEAEKPIDHKVETSPAKKPAATETKPNAPANKTTASVSQKNGWTIYQNCQLVSHNNNDGDSFRIRLPNGSVEVYRLYFVDTPESTFKRYRDGNTNAERISQQARYFGGITPEAATAVGQKAKKFTLALLESTPFTLATKREEVYDSGRYYAHVSLDYEGKTRWLDEILVGKGFVRIITQPADLPDGTKAEAHRTLLRKMEAEAKRNRVGAWQ